MAKFGSILVVVGAILCLFFFFGTGRPNMQRLEPEPTRAVYSPSQLELPLSVPPSKDESHKVKSADLRNKFFNTKNYGSFIYEAMQKPEEGGRFYAYLAFQKCAQVDTVAFDTAPRIKGESSEREKALLRVKELKEKCDSVKTMYASEREFILALRNANSRQADALMGKRATVGAAKPDTYLAELEKARDSGDPIALAAAVDANINFLAEAIDPAYKNGNNKPILYIATAAAVCEHIGTCKSRDDLDAACIVGGNCQFQDARDFLKAEVDPQFHDLYEKSRKAILEFMRRKST